MAGDFVARTEALLLTSGLPEPDRCNLRLRVLVDHLCADADHPASVLEPVISALCDALPRATAAAIAAIARRVATHPQADTRLLTQLVERGGEAAAVALRTGRGFEPAFLMKIAESGDAVAASGLAKRSDLTSEISAALLRRPERDVLIAVAANRRFTLDRSAAIWLVSRARFDHDLARHLLARAPLACDLTPLFMLADGPTRDSLIAQARRRAIGVVPEYRVPLPSSVTADIEQAILRRDREALASIFARRLGISRGDAARLINDTGGEPMALMCNVSGVSSHHSVAIHCWLQERGADDLVIHRLDVLSTELAPQIAKRILSAIAGRPLVDRHKVRSVRAVENEAGHRPVASRVGSARSDVGGRTISRN